jgi:hypothetical protein
MISFVFHLLPEFLPFFIHRSHRIPISFSPFSRIPHPYPHLCPLNAFCAGCTARWPWFCIGTDIKNPEHFMGFMQWRLVGLYLFKGTQTVAWDTTDKVTDISTYIIRKNVKRKKLLQNLVFPISSDGIYCLGQAVTALHSLHINSKTYGDVATLA